MATKQKQEALKFLARVPGEHVFYCRDERILKDMQELGEALAIMADETFAYHSNIERKDFSNWLADTIGDKKLAKDLENASDRNEAAVIVARRIAALRKISA